MPATRTPGWRLRNPLGQDRSHAPPDVLRPRSRLAGRQGLSVLSSSGTSEGLERTDGLSDTRHAKADTARALAGGVRVARMRTAVAQDAGVCDEMVRRGRGDRRGDDVAGPRLFVRPEVHQPAVTRPPGHARRASVLASFAGRDQQFHSLPYERASAIERDLLLQLNEPFIAFLHNGFR